MNHTIWPSEMRGYPDMLASAGYHVGYTGKGWVPGDWKISGRRTNPAGVEYNAIKNVASTSSMSPINYAENFAAFLHERPSNAPFCFWFGALEPHRPYEEGSGRAAGGNPDSVQVPAFLPDAQPVRGFSAL